MNEFPKVSVIIMSYNHADYITQSIMSVVNQTYKNVELIVTDDASKDTSAIIIKQLAEQHHFKYIAHEVNAGTNKNILSGLALVTGEYLAILASDDYFIEDKIEKQLKFILENKLDGVYSTGYVVENGKPTLIPIPEIFSSGNNKDITRYVYLNDTGPLFQSGLFSMSMISALSYLRNEYKLDDMPFLIKAFENYKVRYLNQPSFYYRLHPNNSYKNYWNTFPMRIDILSRLFPEEYKTRGLGNIIFSQGQFLLMDKKFFLALKYYCASLFLHFSFRNIKSMALHIAVYFKQKLMPGKK